MPVGGADQSTIVAALNRVARECGVAQPSSWLTATQKDQVEIREDWLLQTVEDILDRLDLPAPIGAQTTISGDGSENYALPSDFRRVQRDRLAIYDTSLDQPCIPVTNDGDYTAMKDLGTAGITRFYRIKGYDGAFTVDFYREPSSDVVVSYITNNWKATAAGTAGDTFTFEDDVLLLPRRAIEAGCVWRFRERRGLPYQDKYNEYEATLTRLSNDSRGRRSIQFGEHDNNVRWQDLIPAFIPSS